MSEPLYKRFKLLQDTDLDGSLSDTWSDVDSSPKNCEMATFNQMSVRANGDDNRGDEDADSWWVEGPISQFRFLMRLDSSIVIHLSRYCLTSTQQLPLGNGWVLEEGPLFELAHDTELNIS
jgi:hypothetical protein